MFNSVRLRQVRGEGALNIEQDDMLSSSENKDNRSTVCAWMQKLEGLLQTNHANYLGIIFSVVPSF